MMMKQVVLLGDFLKLTRWLFVLIGKKQTKSFESCFREG